MAIGGCTIAELKGRMSRVEFIRWKDFYTQNPFDDHHRYHRPAAFIGNQMSGVLIEKALGFLENKPEREESDVDLSVFKAFGAAPSK